MLSADIKNIVAHDTIPPRPIYLPLTFKLSALTRDKKLGNFLYQSEEIVLGVKETQKYYRSDVVLAYFDTTVEAEAAGCKVKPFDNNIQVVQPVITSSNDLSSIDVQSIQKKGRIPVILDVISKLKLIYRNQPIACSATSPLTLANQLCKDFGILLTQDNKQALEILSITCKIFLKFARTLCENGVDILFILEDSPPKLGESTWSKLVSDTRSTFGLLKYFGALSLYIVRPTEGKDVDLKSIYDFAGYSATVSGFSNVELLNKFANEQHKTYGLSVPFKTLEEVGNDDSFLRSLISYSVRNKCALVTSEWDITTTNRLQALNVGLTFLRGLLLST